MGISLAISGISSLRSARACWSNSAGSITPALYSHSLVAADLDDVGTDVLECGVDHRVTLGVYPRYRYAVFLGVTDDFRGSSPSPGLLAVPQGDERVAAIHHVAPGSLVGLVAIQPIRSLPGRFARPGQEAAELLFRGFALEVLDVLFLGQRQRHLEPGILIGEYLLGDQPVGSFGQRRNHHENQSDPWGDGHQFLQPAQRLADRRAEGIGIREIVMAGDPDPEGERNAPVTTRLFTRLCRFHVRDRTPGDAA